MGCMNASGYTSGPIEPFNHSNKSNFQAYLIEQLILLGFQESQIVISKNIEIKYIPYLKELQTSIQQNIHSPFDRNIYLVPALTNQLRELYIKTSEFLLKYQDYKLNTLIDNVGLKYQSLLRCNDQFPKQLNLRLLNNQIVKTQIDANITIFIINQKDIGYQLLQMIKSIDTKFLLIFKYEENLSQQLDFFIQANSFINFSYIIGFDDKDERYNIIMNLYSRSTKKQKKAQNSDSHSRMLTQFLNQEDQEQFWEDGTLVFNVLSSNSQISNHTNIIKIENQRIVQITEFGNTELNNIYKEKVVKTIDQYNYKSVKQIMIKELIQALQLRSSQFQQYFKLKLGTVKIYKELKLDKKQYQQVQIKVQNINDIDSRTQEIIKIIKKASYDTLLIKQSSKFQIPYKQRIYSLLKQLSISGDIEIQYNSIIHIQWSYGDSIIGSRYDLKNMQIHYQKYKWKMIKYCDNFRLINLPQPFKINIFNQSQALLKCLQLKSDQEVLKNIISSITQDKWQINEEYYPINDVYQISFFNSTNIDETSQIQEKLDKIILSQDQRYLIIFLMDYQDPQKISQLDQIISLPLSSDIKLVILSENEFDNDNFDELINKKKIEKRIYQKNIQFWFPISTQINEITFKQYLDIFYNLNQKENVIIINNRNLLRFKITGFQLITMIQDKSLLDDEKKQYNPQSRKDSLKSDVTNEQKKKLRQQLKQQIEKEIKQQQQLSLQNEQDNQTNLMLDFQWPKQIELKISAQDNIQIVSKKFLKPNLINTSGMQLEMFSQIVSNKQYDFL